MIEINSERWFDITNLKNEIWKDIKGYKNLYQISNYGRVKSLARKNVKKDKILKAKKHNRNYLIVGLYRNRKMRTFYIHRLVAQAFIPNPKCKNTVNHKLGNKSDNRIESLEWNTYIENNQHARRCGLSYTTPVNQYDINWNFIKKWKSIKEAETTLRIYHICDCCNKRRNHAGGFRWSYVDE